MEPQLEYLGRHFDEITFVPYLAEGREFDLPNGFRCDRSLASIRWGRFFSPRIWARALGDADVRAEFKRHPQARWTVMKQALIANAAEYWANKIPEEALCYSMTMDAVALGVARRHRVVCRCLGGDVIDEVRESGFVPLKGAAAQAMERIFPCSQHLTDYLTRQFRGLKAKFETARMGVADPGFMAPISQDRVRRVFSCGALIPNKRYDLLASGLRQLAAKHKAVRFEWKHIPLGSSDAFMKRLELRGVPTNLKVIMEDESVSVMEMFRNGPVDLFAHMSASEGLPFVIMEALSCGVPVLATDVGGVPEVVNSANGRLVPADLNAAELGQSLWEALEHPDLHASQKAAARVRWQEQVNADVNYPKFARRLAGVAGLEVD